jgi:hypothetical protein
MTTNWLRTFEARAVGSYDPRTADLAVFRILYASFILLAIIPVAAWLPLAPRAFFYPPIGLAALFTATPPPSVLLGLNALLSLFAAMLLVGWRTGVASAGTGVTLLVLDAWAYSLGKINHDILLVVTPLVLGFSGWGRALSVDATCSPSLERERAEAVPVILLALMIGFAMFNAGWAKATTGWIDPELRCTYGHFVLNYFFTGRETWASPWALRFDSGWFWKGADWATVALELAFLPAAIHRRLFIPILSVATFFHLGVMLLFDIPFSVNLLVYGAFVRYMEWPLFRTLGTLSPLPRSKAVIAFMPAFAVGLAATLGGKAAAIAFHIPLHEIVVWLGVGVGAGYIIWTLWDMGRKNGADLCSTDDSRQ